MRAHLQGVVQSIHAALPVGVRAVNRRRHFAGHRLVVQLAPAFPVVLHLRLNFRHHAVQHLRHVLRREGLVHIRQLFEELALVVGMFQQFQENRVVDFLFAHALDL